MSCRLSRIVISFPRSALAREVFDPLATLVGQAPNAAVTDTQVSLIPSWPPSALPVTVLRSAAVGRPEVAFETDDDVAAVGPWPLGSSGGAEPGLSLSTPAGLATSRLLSMADACRRLQGCIVRVDHIGVNVSAAAWERTSWELLLRQLGALSALY